VPSGTWSTVSRCSDPDQLSHSSVVSYNLRKLTHPGKPSALHYALARISEVKPQRECLARRRWSAMFRATLRSSNNSDSRSPFPDSFMILDGIRDTLRQLGHI
jgi:hypothetical protein